MQHQRRLAPATLENYAHALQLLLGLADGKSLANLEAADIRRFLAVLHSKGLAPRTLALTLSAWRGCFHWLVKHRGWRA
ncbi:MAG: site-specific integrase, partial [Betaproteobacteria bacterium]